MTVERDGDVVLQESLPPVQYLIMEVLGSRKRLGEHGWTFPSKMNPQLVALAREGLLNWKAATIPCHSLAWLTPAGEQCCLSEEYLLTREYQEPAGNIGLEQVQSRLRDQYGEARDCIGCGQRFMPRSPSRVFCTERCQQRTLDREKRAAFTPEMEAELYSDAKAGRISGWCE